MNTNKYDINIKDFLEYMGENVIKHGQTAYKLERHDSFIITKKRPNFFYWNSRAIGGGIDKLLENLYQITGSNKAKIINKFLQEVKESKFKSKYDDIESTKEFKDIKFKSNETKITGYLSNVRKIDDKFINSLIKHKLINIDNYNNIAFVIKDMNEENKGFELVGTTNKKFRQNTSNSYGFNLNMKNENTSKKTLYIFESSIDLLSFVELKTAELEKIRKYENVTFLSLSGLRYDILNNYIKEKNKLVVCIDNDDAGEKFYSTLLEKYKDIEIERIIPKNKDFNDDLKEMKNLDKSPWEKVSVENELER